MAVVQISRIQVRRGKIAQGTSLPQLASGELAWAIDSQELYIGNGSVAEGSPGVGNTKILTLNDLSANGNILALIQYIYQAGTVATGIGGTVTSRPIQLRLDDTVISTDFGTQGNGVPTADSLGYTVPIGGVADGDILQLAINTLYLNTLPANSASGVVNRHVLVVPPGVYILNSTLFIPSFVTLQGAGSEKTIFYYTGSSTVLNKNFVSGGAIGTSTVVLSSVSDLVQGMSVSGSGIASGTLIDSINNLTVTLSIPTSGQVSGSLSFNTNTLPAIQFVNDSFNTTTNRANSATTYNNQPRSINISGITVWTALGTNAAFQIDSVRDGEFTDIYFKGNVNIPNSPNTNCIGLKIGALSSVVTTERVVFRDCKFEKFYAMVSSLNDIRNITWDNCYFFTGYYGFLFGIDGNSVVSNGVTVGQQLGARQCVIKGCKFNAIRYQALLVQLGTGNVIEDAELITVGSLTNFYGNTQVPQIYFASLGNKVMNIYSDRSTLMGDAAHLITPYIAEVSGYATHSAYATTTFSLVQRTDPTFLFRLPLKCNKASQISGVIMYNVDYVYASNGTTNFSRKGQITIVADASHNRVQLSDDFVNAGLNTTADALNLDFTAAFLDGSGVRYTGAGGQVITTLGIYYANTLSGDIGTLTVTYLAVT